MNASGLTQKQENFCLSYLETGNASEAYRRSYQCEKMKSTTINRNAFALLDNSKIVTRIKDLRDSAADKAVLSFESHLEKLAELRDQAIVQGNIAAAIAAEHHRGKAAGHYTDKLKVDNTHVFTKQELSVLDGVPRV